MSTRSMSVVHLASEMAPLVKVGGLADVVGALSAEQARRGHRVVVALPDYRTLRLPEGWSREPLGSSEVKWRLVAPLRALASIRAMSCSTWVTVLAISTG